MKDKILIVDDNAKYLDRISQYLEREFDCLLAESIESGLERIKENPKVVLLDLEFETKTDGITAIPRFKEVDPHIPIIMLTKHDEYQLVVKAMKSGASNYFVKSPNLNELVSVIKKTMHTERLEEQLHILKNEVTSLKGKLIGSSEVMNNVRNEINKAARMDCPVLITGETGVGKELVARAIHENSPRKNLSFIAVNITTINSDLFSDELFGHEKGAFTGAFQRKKGLFELAEGGTLFLDEIGCLPIDSQVKLLRVLEEKTIRRVGGSSNININVRVIAATNMDLNKSISKESFRKDLYFRLNAFMIDIPQLRERTEDILEIIEYYLKQRSFDLDIMDQAALDLLTDYDWPGNIRQLKNIIEILTSDPEIINIKDVHLKNYLISGLNNESQTLTFPIDYFNRKYKSSRDEILKYFRQQYIKNILEKTNGNITKASQISGLNRTTIHKLLDQK